MPPVQSAYAPPPRPKSGSSAPLHVSALRTAGWQLFALAFCSLFLELAVIRWVPAVVRLVAYYANLLLISSFLGLGTGALLASRRRSLLGWFPALLIGFVALVVLCKGSALPATEDEMRFFASSSKWWNYLELALIFASNAAMFVPLGQRIGRLFQVLPVIRAYSFDLAGSIAATLAFGACSWAGFSPLFGISLCLLALLLQVERRQWLWFAPLFVVALVGVKVSYTSAALWSPYYFVTMHEAAATYPIDILHGCGPPLVSPPADIRTMLDPPIFVARVNGDFYQLHFTLRQDRYTADTPKAIFVAQSWSTYALPYQVARGRKRVLVLGAGGGPDVEAALLSGAEHVDAVEIDPALVELSRRFNPSDVYDDPRVAVHNADARAFLQRARPGYDLVAFGLLDSQALFSSMENIRLDGFTYTVEGIRAAYKLLADDGVLSITFAAGRDWLAQKLLRMVGEATGKVPLVYVDQGGGLILCVPKGAVDAPDRFGQFARLELPTLDTVPNVPVATDDWPFLYLPKKAIPLDYLVPLGMMLALSAVALVPLSSAATNRLQSAHFFFLGCGFLLLETKSIADCSIYFGSTRLVTTIVVAGVLLMVLAANLAATCLRGSPRWLYAPLLLSLLLVYCVPRELILSAEPWARIAWTVLAVPLPLFFAGIIFSTSLRGAADPAALLGANILGAVLGGFCEYLGMWTGLTLLGLPVAAFYLGSLACRQLMLRNGSRD